MESVHLKPIEAEEDISSALKGLLSMEDKDKIAEAKKKESESSALVNTGGLLRVDDLTKELGNIVFNDSRVIKEKRRKQYKRKYIQ
ncbi:MAG: hypothetical protein HGA35_03780 [Erysipelotrichaceae bacterium]|nr:hypothetical protein [Erysipelotrichaceae bacterium]